MRKLRFIETDGAQPMPGFMDQHRNAAPGDNATHTDDVVCAWELFASEIDAVELEIAEVSSLASHRGIWADRFTVPPGHHERNLLENVRVAIAQLRECV